MANVGDRSTCRTCGQPIRVIRGTFADDPPKWTHDREAGATAGYEKGKHLVHTAKGADGKNTA